MNFDEGLVRGAQGKLGLRLDGHFFAMSNLLLVLFNVGFALNDS